MKPKRKARPKPRGGLFVPIDIDGNVRGPAKYLTAEQVRKMRLATPLGGALMKRLA